MKEPWNLKEDDLRQADLLPTFIIFCEDEVSEPIYFKYFESPLIKVNVIEGQRSKTHHVLKAITHCYEKGFLQKADGVTSTSIDEGLRIWCVFDRDIEDADDDIRMGNVDFDESIETANRHGIRVAWSNDAFELWILLHFEEIDAAIDETKNRTYYYEKLTKIFANDIDPNEYLSRAKTYSGFNYKSTLKQKSNFRFIVREQMIPKTKAAIQRGRLLEQKFEGVVMPNHEKTPCTLVHHLIEELIGLGRKIDISR